jgi:peroxiredoxin
MKQLTAILIITAILASCSAPKNQFTLQGTVKGIDTGYIYLQKKDADIWVSIDSAKLDKGAFSFKGEVILPEMYHLSLAGDEIVLPFFVENSEISVILYTDSVDRSVVTGSATQDLYKSYLTANSDIESKMEESYKAWKVARDTNDTVIMHRLDSVYSALEKDQRKLLKDFIVNNKASVVSPYLVMRNSWQFELPELEEIDALYDTTLNASEYLKKLKSRIDILKNVEIGKTAPDFTMNDSTGTPVALSSFKGKVLLVDFWASWCSPCRAENPNVVKAYQTYHKKGFEILGCSFDQDKTRWMNAVKEDKLTWYHVSDLKGWGNEAGKLYGVNSIPANVLLDKDQKIIARNLRGEDLMKKLEEVFGK